MLCCEVCPLLHPFLFFSPSFAPPPLGACPPCHPDASITGVNTSSSSSFPFPPLFPFSPHVWQVPFPVFTVSSLTKLDLRNNHLRFVPPDMERLDSLRVLDLSNNPLRAVNHLPAVRLSPRCCSCLFGFPCALCRCLFLRENDCGFTAPLQRRPMAIPPPASRFCSFLPPFKSIPPPFDPSPFSDWLS